MKGSHWRYVLIEQGVGAGVFNAVLNGGIAWLLFRSMAGVPLWGQKSLAGDVIATAFLLPFTTTVIVTPTTLLRTRFGRPPRLQGARAWSWLPPRLLSRAFWLGGVVTALVAPLTVAALWALSVDPMPYPSFFVFKATFGGILGLAVTPVVAFAALDDSRLP